jgi:hypothetical protein
MHHCTEFSYGTLVAPLWRTIMAPCRTSYSTGFTYPYRFPAARVDLKAKTTIDVPMFRFAARLYKYHSIPTSHMKLLTQYILYVYLPIHNLSSSNSIKNHL